MEVQKIKLEPIRNTVRKQTGKLRVAAYCRVSTDTEDQRTSFEGQAKHYTELIEGNPGEVLRKANNFCLGEILDQRINDFQNR